MKQQELNEILELHKKWLKSAEEGERANLRSADLRRANLEDANLDYSAWPLWCGTAKSSIKVGDKIKAQLLYHAFIVSSESAPLPTPEQLAFIKENFHRYGEVESLEYRAGSK